MAITKEAQFKIRIAAQLSDFEAARNWEFITTDARGWNVEAQEQFMDRYCEFSHKIEKLKDDFDLTYAEIAEMLT